MQGDETAAAEELAEGETTAAGLEGETMAAQAAVAWSLDETPTVWHGRPVSAVLAVLVLSTAAIVALLVLLLTAVLRPTQAPSPRPPVVVTVTPSPTAAPAPPPPAPAPTATVTVHAEPPPAPPAPAPAPNHGRFAVCPSGHDGVVSGTPTSCAFADNVRRAYYNQGQPDSLVAYSPVTDESYLMQCFGPYRATFTNGDAQDVVKCVGGNDAEVVVW
jgi:hypothetical protein